MRLSAIALVAALVGAGCSGTGDGSGDTTTTTTMVAQPIADGEWFAMVTVGTDESEEMTLGVDLAEMLTGEEARLAAVEDGVIAEDEDLANDFYIDNDETVLELLEVTDDVRFLLISGSDTSEQIAVDGDAMARLWDGSYEGDPIYGIVPGSPIAMNVTVTDGLVSRAEAVYLP